MATRNRTRVFLKFRSNPSGARLDSEVGEGSDSQFLGPNDTPMDRSSLPPEWVDIVEKIEDEMKAAESKIKTLTSAYESRLKVSFNKDVVSQDRKIDTMSQEITSIFRKADSNLKRIATIGNEEGKSLPMQERVVRLNVMRSLARRIQDLSKTFKNKQKQFLLRKKNQEQAGNEFFDPEMDEADTMLTDEQQLEMMQQDRRATQRQKDIDQIIESVRELNQIFREMSILVVEQGTVLDRIDYQIELTHQRVQAGNVELHKANAYSESASKKFWWCFGILLVLIVILLGINISKFQN